MIILTTFDIDEYVFEPLSAGASGFLLKSSSPELWERARERRILQAWQLTAQPPIIRIGPGGLRFVDAPEVGEIREGAVVLSANAAQVDQLPEPSPNPAVMEHHGVEDSEGKLEHKLRRAWEIVSGRG